MKIVIDGRSFGDELSVFVEPGDSVGCLVANEQVSFAVGNDLNRPLKLTVPSTVAADRDKISRKLFRIVQ